MARRVPLSATYFSEQRQTLPTPLQIACHAGKLHMMALLRTLDHSVYRLPTLHHIAPCRSS